MATYTTSQRIKTAYRRCDGRTCGFGPVGFNGRVFRVQLLLRKAYKARTGHRVGMMRIIQAIR